MLVKQLELFIQHPCVSIRNLEVVHQLDDFWFQGLRRCGHQMTHGGDETQPLLEPRYRVPSFALFIPQLSQKKTRMDLINLLPRERHTNQ